MNITEISTYLAVEKNAFKETSRRGSVILWTLKIIQKQAYFLVFYFPDFLCRDTGWLTPIRRGVGTRPDPAPYWGWEGGGGREGRWVGGGLESKYVERSISDTVRLLVVSANKVFNTTFQLKLGRQTQIIPQGKEYRLKRYRIENKLTPMKFNRYR